MNKNPLPRLDQSEALRSQLLPYCRLAPGEIWEDEVNGHRVGCLDASDSVAIARFMGKERAALAIHDPPYNVAAFEIQDVSEFVEWCSQWISLTYNVLSKDASLYIWIGADQNDGFHDYDARAELQSEKLHNDEKPARLWHPKELDGCATGIALLRQRQS